MVINRSFFNIFADDLAATRSFYADWLGFSVRFASDWFVQFVAPGNDALEVGVLRRDHEIVPAAAAGAIQGGMLTLVVDDVDVAYKSAVAAAIAIEEPPRDLFYGQRRMLVLDPAGTVVDMSSECEPDPAWLAKLRQTESGGYEEG